jgi:hypothetical protein
VAETCCTSVKTDVLKVALKTVINECKDETSSRLLMLTVLGRHILQFFFLVKLKPILGDIFFFVTINWQ